MNDHSTNAIDLNREDVADSIINAEIDEDDEALEQFLAEDDSPLPSLATTGLPGGGIAFSTRGCATAEQADAALEAFLMRAFGVSDEDD